MDFVYLFALLITSLLCIGLILLAVTFLLCLRPECTCSDAEQIFEEVYLDVSTGISLYRDTMMDVMYVGYDGVSLTPMLHPDGTPLLYSEWAEMRGAE